MRTQDQPTRCRIRSLTSFLARLQPQIMPQSNMHRLSLHRHGISSPHIHRSLCVTRLCRDAHGFAHLGWSCWVKSSLEGKHILTHDFLSRLSATSRECRIDMLPRSAAADVLRDRLASDCHRVVRQRIHTDRRLAIYGRHSSTALTHKHRTTGRHACLAQPRSLRGRTTGCQMGLEVESEVGIATNVRWVPL